MLEKHPYKPFVPKNAKYLILGSFPAKAEERGNWYYVNPRNQFWPILEKVYNANLTTIKSKKKLFTNLKIAITDIIYSCEREKGSNLDTNLTNITYNIKGINKILNENKIRKIFLTSRFVEKNFKKHFKKFFFKNPEVKLIYLPSPSPRYAAMNIDKKTKIYKKLLPKLK
jgi:hypoxanthine-DNA glycosylase